jgi:hypothetical protein
MRRRRLCVAPYGPLLSAILLSLPLVLIALVLSISCTRPGAISTRRRRWRSLLSIVTPLVSRRRTSRWRRKLLLWLVWIIRAGTHVRLAPWFGDAVPLIIGSGGNHTSLGQTRAGITVLPLRLRLRHLRLVRVVRIGKGRRTGGTSAGSCGLACMGSRSWWRSGLLLLSQKEP